jgi:hypothetical protein
MQLVNNVFILRIPQEEKIKNKPRVLAIIDTENDVREAEVVLESGEFIHLEQQENKGPVSIGW